MRASIQRPMARILGVASAVLVVADTSLAAPAPPTRTHTVVIEKMKFGPMPRHVRPGDTILWVNRDIFRHTATARDGSFDLDLPPKTQGRTLVRRTGRVIVYCKYHTGMQDVLVVNR
jgi:plastocyanin